MIAEERVSSGGRTQPGQRAVDRNGEKLCNTEGCGWQPKTEFTLQCNTKDGLRGSCRKCSAAYHRRLKEGWGHFGQIRV